MDDEPLPPKLSFACPQRWEAMRVVDPQKRFCERCQLHVHDLSSLSKAEGRHFLAEARGQICVSYEQRADGTMLTRSRWSRWEQRWNRVRRGAFALLAVLAPFSFAACSSREPAYRTGGSTCVSDTDGKDTPPKPDDSERVSGKRAIPSVH